MNIENIKNKIKRNKFELIFTLVYAIITFIIAIFFHEKWRDEAQAWLIARDLNLVDIIKQMSYEGHPPLWHFILAPFAKLGFPYITESIISWAIMVINVWLILKKSPFKKEFKILIILSLPYLYLYPVISRSYCLIPLGLSLTAIYYPKRNEKKIQYTLSILLLAYTHIIMLGLAGMLYLFYFLEQIFYTKKSKSEKRYLIISILIAGIGILILFLMLKGGTDKNTELSLLSFSNFNLNKLKLTLNKILASLFGIVSYNFGFKVYIIIWLLIYTIHRIKNYPKGFIIALVSVLWQLYIYIFIFGLSQQKSNTILLIILFIEWLYYYNKNSLKNTKNEKFKDEIKKIIEIGFIVLLILNSMEAVNSIKSEISKKYSCAEEASAIIEKKLENDAIFICSDAPFASALIPYTENKKYWNPSSEEFFTYVTWNKVSNTYLNVEEILKKVKKNFSINDNIYLIICDINETTAETKNVKEELEEYKKKNILSEVYKSKTQSIISDECYGIYKIYLNK